MNMQIAGFNYISESQNNTEFNQAKSDLESLSVDLSDLRKDLGTAIINAQKVIDDLKSDSGSFLGDHLWYPDNPKRKAKAIDLFESYIKKCEQAEKLTDQNQRNTTDLLSVLISTQSWGTYLSTLTPVADTSQLLKKPGDSGELDFKVINLVTATSVAGAWKLFNYAKKANSSFSKAYIGATLALGFIQSIFNGKARKDNFEQLIKDGEKSNKSIDELIGSLEEMNKEAHQKFYDISQVIEKAKFAPRGEFTNLFNKETLEISADDERRRAFFSTLERATTEMREWYVRFMDMLTDIEEGDDPKLSAKRAARNTVSYEERISGNEYSPTEKEARKTLLTKVFLLSYELNNMKEDNQDLEVITKNVQDIADECGLDGDERDYVLTRALLLNGFNPGEIIEIVDAPEAVTIQKIELVTEQQEYLQQFEEAA